MGTAAPAASAESLMSVLADDIDTESAVRSRRLAVLPLAAFHPPEGQRVVERSLAEGFSAVRMSIDVDGALSARVRSDYAVVDRHVADQVRTLPVRAMCQYPRSAATGASLQVTVEEHLAGVRQAGFETAPGPQGLALRGDLEIANRDVVGAVVRAAVARAALELRLDLSHLTFVDVDSCRRLAELTREFRTAGGQLTLVAPPPHVERLLRLVNVLEQPGIRLVTP